MTSQLHGPHGARCGRRATSRAAPATSILSVCILCNAVRPPTEANSNYLHDHDSMMRVIFWGLVALDAFGIALLFVLGLAAAGSTKGSPMQVALVLLVLPAIPLVAALAPLASLGVALFSMRIERNAALAASCA